MWPDPTAMIVLAAAIHAPTVPPHRFLALGDSYSIGEGVAADARWPQQLATMLRAQHLAIDDPEMVARTGWTTDELAAAMDAHTFHPPYALVTLLIGVNDQYRGRGVDAYRGAFQHLLERAIRLAGNRPQRVIVVSIPDWGVTRFGRDSGRDAAQIAHALDLYNAANAQIATMLHARYVDVTDLSRAGSNCADMLAADGLHPSASMYRRWAQRIVAQAHAALE